MEKEIFNLPFKPDNDEMKKTTDEALKVLKKYPASVTEQPKINDGSIKIPEKDVKPEDLEKTIDEAEKSVDKIEKRYKKAA